MWASPDDYDNVTFLDYTVKNISDQKARLDDFIPEYTTGNAQIDVSYPENDRFDDLSETFEYQIEPDEELDLVGAIVTEEEDQYYAGFLWNLTQDLPEIVFHTPQSERKDQIGTYDTGEPIYPVARGDNGYLEATIEDISIEEDAEGLNPSTDDSSFLALDMAFENTMDEKIKIEEGIPTLFVDDEEIVFHGVNFAVDGNWIDVHRSVQR